MIHDDGQFDQWTRIVRQLLCEKLAVRLEADRRDVGEYSGPGITDLGVIVGFKDPDFVRRFGVFLDKVTDEDIWNLTRELPWKRTVYDGVTKEARIGRLLQLYDHIRLAPDGKTGLAHFDEWEP